LGRRKGAHASRWALFSLGLDDVQYVTLRSVRWFIVELLEPIGTSRAPAEFEVGEYRPAPPGCCFERS
jgi:hypothetical protein